MDNFKDIADFQLEDIKDLLSDDVLEFLREAYDLELFSISRAAQHLLGSDGQSPE